MDIHKQESSSSSSPSRSSRRIFSSSRVGEKQSSSQPVASVESSVLRNVKEEKKKDSGRERLKRHREEMAGEVRIPEKWSQDRYLKDWMDFSSFDILLAPKGLASAREALIAQARINSNRGASQRLRIF